MAKILIVTLSVILTLVMVFVPKILIARGHSLSIEATRVMAPEYNAPPRSGPVAVIPSSPQLANLSSRKAPAVQEMDVIMSMPRMSSTQVMLVDETTGRPFS